MKVLKSYFAGLMLAAALFTLPLLPLSQVGCTTTQKTVAFQTLSAVATSVDASMKAYNDRLVAGKVDQPTQITVNDLYSKYQASFKTAFDVAHGNLGTLAPADVQALSTDLTNVIKTLTK